jgi:HAD superfamily hydrolase (TIGR01509 family)
MKPMIRALIFDMDGLMIDSERLYFEAEREIARSFGREVSDETLGRMMGRKPLESLELYVRETGLPITAQETYAVRNVIMERKLREDLRPMPGLDHILEAFRGRLKMAVATGAQRAFLDIVLDGLGIRGAFDVLQDSDDIRSGKPDPEIFLAACRRLGLAPAECVVLEDSENGARAGRRAGCTVIAVPSEYTRAQDFSAADHVVPDLREAARRVEALLDGRAGT